MTAPALPRVDAIAGGVAEARLELLHGPRRDEAAYRTGHQPLPR